MISNSITPVATARLSESALPAIGILTSVPAGRGERRRQAGLLAAHHQEHRPAIVGGAVVDGGGEMGADAAFPASAARSASNSAWLARASGTWKIEPIVARTASTENGSTVSPTRITPSAPTASTVRMMVPRLPGSRIASSAT